MNLKLVCSALLLAIAAFNVFAQTDSSDDMIFDNLAIRRSSVIINGKNISEIIVHYFDVEKPTL